MSSFQILTALSFLSALCTLSAAVPNDGIMPAHQKVLIAVTGNKVPIPCIFQGSGEGVNMVNIVSNNTTLCNVAGDSPLRPLPLVFTFQFSVTGTGGPFINTPIVQTSNTSLGTTTLITAQTEDSTDNDLNDSVVNIIVQAPPSSIAVPQAVKSASLASALVESNLSFQPTVNITVSVGAFSGNSTLSEFSASTQDWGKVTGEIIDIHQEPIFPNLLLMRFLFSESTSDQPEMQNATLLLNGIVSFRGARPTGTPTSGVGWISELIPGDL
ncbi:hypothetical protein BDP27DRAFT_1405594 [Rhodocollybia butyracea]|uniref:Uncharacterized protein n=1 Tax=Rhodocollybia butyracea TaxID=206335 RepID=A0A9P5PIL4_9AGAR|nr:hypothetical protein BDP27DRAFT_1405594 [Rhodocollybia butyracea]